MRAFPLERHRHVAAAVLFCLLLATAVAFADDVAADREGATELHVSLDAAGSTPEHVRCGFDELEARTRPSRVMGISRIVRPDAPERNIDPEAAVLAGSTTWEPIRIRVYTEDLNSASRYCTAAGQTRPNYQGGTVTCTSDDVLTSAKKKVLTEYLVPSAIKLHEDRLNVQRVTGNIVVDAASFASDPICGQFTIPSAHTTTGVSGADFVLYMSSGPTEGNVIAWATTCQQFTNGRPSVGASNVSPKYISADPQTVRVVTHEILHALGFSISFFSSQSMYSAASIRGKGWSPVITSANVVAKAKAQYGCSTQRYMELEDQGGAGTAYSHWKRRSAKDELMAGISGVGHYTALTIAAMEDMGFYKGNYANAEPMSYGQNAGCALTTSKCVINGVSKFPSMYCTDTSSNMKCTSDHTGMGYCAIGQYTTSLPTYFRYFTNTKQAGIDALMDYCPYIQGYSNTNCTTDTGILLGNTYGVNSRCFDAPSGFVSGGYYIASQLAICADVKCGTSTYSVKVKGASGYTTCTPGSTLTLSTLSSSFSSGTITCPAYNEVCIGQVNATEYGQYASASVAAPAIAFAETAAEAAPTTAGADDGVVATRLSSSVVCAALLLALFLVL